MHGIASFARFRNDTFVLKMASGSTSRIWDGWSIRVFHEPAAFTPEEAASLAARGHALEASRRLYGNMNVVTWEYAGNLVEAAVDPRGLIEGWIYSSPALLAPGPPGALGSGT
jgi:hypothetical protein